jgi:hypothetical protein
LQQESRCYGYSNNLPYGGTCGVGSGSGSESIWLKTMAYSHEQTSRSPQKPLESGILPRSTGATARWGGCFIRTQYKFIDPSDEQSFWSVGNRMGYLHYSDDITKSDQWKQLEKLRQYCSDLSAKGSLRSDTYTATFQLWDDGWRMVKPR